MRSAQCLPGSRISVDRLGEGQHRVGPGTRGRGVAAGEAEGPLAGALGGRAPAGTGAIPLLPGQAPSLRNHRGLTSGQQAKKRWGWKQKQRDQ